MLFSDTPLSMDKMVTWLQMCLLTTSISCFFIAFESFDLFFYFVVFMYESNQYWCWKGRKNHSTCFSMFCIQVKGKKETMRIISRERYSYIFFVLPYIHASFHFYQEGWNYTHDNRKFQSVNMSKETTPMSNQMNWSLHTIPVELVYRILDHLDDVTILLTCRNICARLDAITDTYYRYQVIFVFIV